MDPEHTTSGFRRYICSNIIYSCQESLLLKQLIMNWKNAIKDGLPLDNQEVLISVNGINHVAFYSENEKGFRIRNDGKFLPLHGQTIYWYPITPPYR